MVEVLSSLLEKEWLETNGLGGFASGTVAGIHTRRYHGLLTAATQPPVGRMLLLSKFEETVEWRGRRYELSANQYPDGIVHPRGGVDLLVAFRHAPLPEFVYRLEDGVTVTRRIFMVHGANTVVVEYELPEDATNELRPLIAFRDYHSTTHENGALDATVGLPRQGEASVRPYGDLPALRFFFDASGSVEKSGHWYRNFEYAIERERGLDFREDLFQPFVLRMRGSGAVVASLQERPSGSAAELRLREIARRDALRQASPVKGDRLIEALTVAADAYLVDRGHEGGKTIIAGYHWFSDWGRDTMIALPGLTLVTGRFDVAKRILCEFAAAIDQGMLPNRFPDAGEAAPEYNTVDATLWFFEAVRAYAAYSGDVAFVREELVPRLREIIEWHVRGTRYGIRVDPEDGLLRCGEPGVQLTWMDAKIGDWVVTPRTGKPVEIQALWYNALRVLSEYAAEYGAMAERVRQSFVSKFWNAAAGCLYDVVLDDGSCDASMRPNQIFAVSLPHSMLAGEMARSVVDAVRRELLTPMGLRSLSPSDPRYRGSYSGGVWERDSAYHQGTVWPWLMGPFLTAFVKTGGDRGQAEAWLRGFGAHLETAGLGHVSEIADGDAPHTPRGCVAQAWSVAELLRAACEDVILAPHESVCWRS